MCVQVEPHASNQQSRTGKAEPDEKKAPNRCAGLDALARSSREPGGKPARADHIFGSTGGLPIKAM